ncbi:ABC transporter permease [Clostridium sp. C8-1-8]|uniref:ABC transporter permease n=1 Tax=Clostridium sp. C8-1-8 TaxID=2698831 RepID=UPI0013696FB2|nr:ABC transporter permease [Clostridium sp. C8-1-8]
MYTLKMIIDSLKKIKLKVILISVQLIIVLFLVNITVNWAIEVFSTKNNIERIWGNNVICKLTLDLSGNKNNATETLNRIKSFSSIENILYIKSDSTTTKGFFGQEYIKEHNIKNEAIEVIIMSKKDFSENNFSFLKGNKDTVPNGIFVGFALKDEFPLKTNIHRTFIKDNQEIEENLLVNGILKKNQVTTNGKNLINLNNSIVIVTDDFFKYIGDENYTDFIRNLIIRLKPEATLNNLNQNLENLKKQDKYLMDYRYSNLLETIALSSKLNTPTYRLILLMSIVVFFLALLGVSGALLSEAMLRKKEYGTRLALGARKKELSLLIYGQFFLIVVISNIVSYSLIILMSNYLNLGEFHIVTSIITTLFCIILASIMSFSSIKRIVNQSISDLIRGIAQ